VKFTVVMNTLYYFPAILHQNFNTIHVPCSKSDCTVFNQTKVTMTADQSFCNFLYQTLH